MNKKLPKRKERTLKPLMKNQRKKPLKLTTMRPLQMKRLKRQRMLSLRKSTRRRLCLTLSTLTKRRPCLIYAF